MPITRKELKRLAASAFGSKCNVETFCSLTLTALERKGIRLGEVQKVTYYGNGAGRRLRIWVRVTRDAEEAIRKLGMNANAIIDDDVTGPFRSQGGFRQTLSRGGDGQFARRQMGDFID